MISEYINGVKVHAVNSRSELIDYAIKYHKILIAVNAEKILHATDEGRSLINRNIGYPDGIGAVWALNKKGHLNVVKIPGCELWLDIIKKNYKKKSFYLIGGKSTVIKETVLLLKNDFPGIQILSYRDGYLITELEKENLIIDVKNLSPDIVFVAMGSPKQELLMEEMQKVHPATYQGLGGSFDVYTGNVLRAPSWFVKNNLEWFYRLLKQPSRIKRQIYLIPFLIKLLFNRI
jgi:UDP-N-acetyl-D-mannosaminouronate:lipid I N-acetyl-D-mannosaminouronosyltransferase